MRAAHNSKYHAATMKLIRSFLLAMLAASAWAQTSALTTEVDTAYPDAYALYLDLHQNPELSSHETQTATKLAGKLRDLGYTVTEHVGGTGVVAILKNGAGPTVMLRTELDGLPVEERPASHMQARPAPRTIQGATSPSCMPADMICT